MKTLKFLFFLFVLTNVTAQIPTGGSELIISSVADYGFYGSDFGYKTDISATPLPFDEAAEITVTTAPTNPWEIAVTFSPQSGYDTGDVLLMAFYARTTESSLGTGTGELRAVVEENTVYTSDLGQNVTIGSDWQLYYLPFVSGQTLSASQINMALQSGFPEQVVEIAQVRLINYENTLTIDDLLDTNNQIPEGGTDLISSSINDYGFYGEVYGYVNNVTITNPPFTEAAEITVTEQPTNPWEIAVTFNAEEGYTAGDVMLMTFYAKATASSDDSGKGLVTAVIQENTVYTSDLSKNLDIETDWKAFYLPFEASQTLEASQINISLQLGHLAQIVEISEVRLINYKDSLALEDLPDSEAIDEEDGELISSEITDYGFYGDDYGYRTNIEIEGQPFTEGVELTVTSQPDSPWGIALTFPAQEGFKTGDVMLMSFYARTTRSSLESGEGFLRAIVEENTIYTSSLGRDYSISDEWKLYNLPFVANQTLEASQINIGLQIGYPEQVLEVAQVRLTNYKDTIEVEELPLTEVTYVGREDDAAWRAEADQRIEQYRKGNMAISIVNQHQIPLSGANVKVTMKSHHFGFGTAVDGATYLSNSRYRDSISSLFNTVVLENNLKWELWADDTQKDITNQTIQAFNDLGIPVRGHVLVWPSFRYNPSFVEDYANDPEGLRTLINTHVTDIASTYEGKLLDWDVINETFNNTEFMDILGYDEMAKWFHLARENDTIAKMYMNDFGILGSGGINTRHQDHYYETIQRIEADGAQIDGIGMQSHFGALLTAPVRLYSILERYSELNKEIKITEFDIAINQRDVQADYTRDFMTMVFSHPSVSSFLMWGFWTGRHWQPDAAMFDLEWNARPNYEAYRSLVFEKWWTPETIYSSDTGTKEINGFLGTYEVEIEYNGKVTTQTIAIDEAGTTKDIVIEIETESFVPEANKTYYITNPHYDVYLGSYGGEAPFASSILRNVAAVKWKITPSDNEEYYYLDCVGGRRKPRLRSDNTPYADMESNLFTEPSAQWNLTPTGNGTYLVTAFENSLNRLQIDEAKKVKTSTTLYAGESEQFMIVDSSSSIRNTKPFNKPISKMKVFPVPAKEKLTISIPHSENYDTLEINDFMGKTLHIQRILSKEDISVDTSKYKPGAYVLKMKNSNGANEFIHFVIN
ncbi:endo-1,4-beta-xylanase [Aquimarina pacifica]|uniref:endo-1,4-beta-xylanase n=1 Tax=Aquimarina pacifica TaxID=1296415 RepID=UPI00046FAC3B|nr:endo-1,4-beta-xylanase [Aquimarina pacifica]